MIMPLGIGLLLFLARNPELSHKLGLVGAKADLAAYHATNWPAYLSFIGQIIASGGFFLATFCISWVFGREFVDGTLKDMLAVPVSRFTILLAKFIVVAIWSALLSLIILTLSLVVGVFINFPDFSLIVLLNGSSVIIVTGCLVIASVFPFALFASIGRGYLLPLALSLLALVVANLAVVIGWGEYFPWAVAGLYCSRNTVLTPLSFWIVGITGLIGIVATGVWWKNADQDR